ncbi:Pancreatic lipase-related protein 3 [Araneus ventricosus]|uniref:Pancreatic lipase-related protein 3 n=1 Tax=Araneus ventricosus TaxID=182803 RepID=A0A4Y2FXN8_ARAVE|nr:Pancreatic lipase-related protein 3 [Araneus ventricosus]
MSCFLLEEFVQSQSIFSQCYPDKEQNCDKDSANLEWPETKMRFLLFTRKNQKQSEMLHMCNGTLPKNSHFNPNNQLVVIIPGFMFGTCEIESIPVTGLVGQQFPVHRITALDPAGVTYTKDTSLVKRLDPGDADIVDVIHTNGGTGLPYLGAYFPMGDADFYVNGGASQPSCSKSVWDAAKHFNFMFVIGVSSVPSFCAHSQAIEYYKLSISDFPGKFVAHACNSYKEFKAGNCTGDGASNVTMGYDFEKSFTPEQRRKKLPRKYYIDTKKAWPFV